MSLENNFGMDIGTCCFCGYECNPCSQSCGSCVRSITGSSFGWNELPDHLQHVYDPDMELETIGETFRDDEYQGDIHYSGIGSVPHLQYMSEGRFRRTIWLNLHNFNKTCPHDPRTCSLRVLVKWTGAKLL